MISPEISPEDFNSEGHWYTSYPSLNHWTEDFGHRQFRSELENYLDHEQYYGGVHLYVHIPFCAKLCHYCICNIVITNNREKIQFFLDHLLKEIDNLRTFYEKQGKKPNIKEIHLGGGTPSHLDRDQFTQLCDRLSTVCDLKGLDEFAMEIDPRTIKEGDLQFYSQFGVTRISFGVQDFDEKVQKAINREQPYEMVERVLQDRHHFKGVNFDLLYGLPQQTLQTFEETLRKTLQISPERITLLKYCHAPEVRRHMKLIKVSELPPGEDLPKMFIKAIETLTSNGYEWVGLDHFAKKTDSLAVAHKEKTLVRTFNGFKPGPTNIMIGLGPTSTSALYDSYAQNHYDLNLYYEAVNKGEFPILRGYKLTADDQRRREIIFELLCTQRLTLNPMRGGLWDEKDALDKLPIDYFSVIHNDYYSPRYIFSEYGRILLRKVCQIFDNKDVKPEHLKIAQKTITRKIIESPARQSA